MRPVVAARGLGLAEGALMHATTYVRGREAFGQTIADFQGVQWEIARCAVDIEAARLLTYRAATLVDEGRFDRDSVPLLSMANTTASELAVRASGLAVQLMGAAGYMADSPTRQWYRDARQLTIVEGTSQVQLDLIAAGSALRTVVVGLEVPQESLQCLTVITRRLLASVNIPFLLENFPGARTAGRGSRSYISEVAMTSTLTAAQIRRELGHPIVDADGHFMELGPLVERRDRLVSGGERAARPCAKVPQRRSRMLDTAVFPADRTDAGDPAAVERDAVLVGQPGRGQP